jgi:hypothetical protein
MNVGALFYGEEYMKKSEERDANDPNLTGSKVMTGRIPMFGDSFSIRGDAIVEIYSYNGKMIKVDLAGSSITGSNLFVYDFIITGGSALVTYYFAKYDEEFKKVINIVIMNVPFGTKYLCYDRRHGDICISDTPVESIVSKESAECIGKLIEDGFFTTQKDPIARCYARKEMV